MAFTFAKASFLVESGLAFHSKIVSRKQAKATKTRVCFFTLFAFSYTYFFKMFDEKSSA